MNDINNTTNAKWYAKKYASYIDIMDNRCVFFARLYKKSTPDAETKARQIVNAFNQQEMEDNKFEALHEKLEDRNTQVRELEEKTMQLMMANRRNQTEPPKLVMQNKLNQANETIYNLSEALCNLSNK